MTRNGWIKMHGPICSPWAVIILVRPGVPERRRRECSSSCASLSESSRRGFRDISHSGQANPMLTIVAMALRLAQHLESNLGIRFI